MAGLISYVHNYFLPSNIKEKEEQILMLQEEKRLMKEKMRFEECARLRDNENRLLEMLSKEKKEWKTWRKKNKPVVSSDDLGEAIRWMTGIPVNRPKSHEQNRLLRAEDDLKTMVFGQDSAIAKVTKAMNSYSIQQKKQNKPIGSFLFVGPPMVGKSLLAKKVSEYYFKDRYYDSVSLIQLNMEDYGNASAIVELVGSSTEGNDSIPLGKLGKQIFQNPYSVLLLHEIDKAHPDIFKVLSSMIKEGVLKDASGKVINCRHLLIIMTMTMKIDDFGRGSPFVTKAEKEVELFRVMNMVHKRLKSEFPKEFYHSLERVFRKVCQIKN
jgi:ATP-dependent Clp protease ATP-binding subunit ClpA